MATLVALVAMFMIGLALYGLFSPQRLAGFVALWRSERGLWAAAAFRVVFAVALWLAASASQAPLALRVLAVVTLAAGSSLPFLGVARYEAMLDWWLGRPAGVRRGWMAFPVVLGAFLLWAVAG